MSKKKYAIVSDNLTGLILASAIEKRGGEALIIDSGQNYDLQKAHFFAGDYFDLAPDEVPFSEALTWFQELTGQPFECTKETLAPQYFSDGELKPFLGFGNEKHDSIEALSQLNRSSFICLNSPLKEGLLHLQKELKAKILPFCEVDHVELDNDHIKSIRLSDTSTIEADHFIFCNSPLELTKSFPADVWGLRTRQRISKCAEWGCLEIRFEHEPPHNNKNLIFFMSNKPENEPFAGRFSDQGSSWYLFFNKELAEDNEFIFNQIKHMKKMLQKAFPSTPAFGENEAVSIYNSLAGSYFWAEGPALFEGGLKNFTFSSHLLLDWPGTASCVASAHSSMSRLF